MDSFITVLLLVSVFASSVQFAWSLIVDCACLFSPAYIFLMQLSKKMRECTFQVYLSALLVVSLQHFIFMNLCLCTCLVCLMIY